MNTIPDDLPRLIHETLEELGWDADADNIAKQVQRLDFGLPLEDEFAVLCSWLGKCELLHKLDQHQMPKASKEKFQVPDLLARFSSQSGSTPLLIEVKSKRENKLSFKPDYILRLQNYADLLGFPLLIAWKYHSLWVLFEAKHLKKAKSNLNISFEMALKENLLGVLVGDFAYKIGAGAGFHLKFQKEKRVSLEVTDTATTENWLTKITEVTFTNWEGDFVRNVSPEVQSLLVIGDLEEEQEHADDHIWARYVATGNGSQFAHMALVKLLDWQQPNGVKTLWRREARKDKLNTINDLRTAVIKGLQEKIVYYVFDVVPHTYPNFVLKTVETESADSSLVPDID